MQCSDLGVSYDEHLSYTFHVRKIANKVAGRAKCIWKCFTSHNSLLLTRVFCTFVRPLLEYSSIIWSLYYKNGINKIEAGQRFFTKAIGNLRSFKYSEQLQYLNLDSLQCRRVKANLKVLHGLVDLETSCFFKCSLYPSTRLNLFKLSKLALVSEHD